MNAIAKGLKALGKKVMRMNLNMANLLAMVNIDLSDEEQFREFEVRHNLVDTNGSVLLEDEQVQQKHIDQEDYQDRTGYECFVNHVHLPCKQEREAVLSALGYIFGLKRSLEERFPDRTLVIIASFSDDEVSVRFHQYRDNERWLAGDLDEYKLEAILEIKSTGRQAGGWPQSQ